MISRVIKAFYKKLDSQFDKLYNPAILIFYSLYARSNYALIDHVYKEPFILSQWEHALQTTEGTFYCTLLSIFSLAKSSSDLQEKVVHVIPKKNKSINLAFNVNSNLTNFALFCLNHYFSYQKNQLYDIEFDLLIRTILSSFTYFEKVFISVEMILRALETFQNMIFIYHPLLLFDVIKQDIMQESISRFLYFHDNKNIFYSVIRILLSLYDLEYTVEVNGKYKCFTLDIRIDHLIKTVNLPFDYPNKYICYNLIKIILQFIKIFDETRDDNLYFPYLFLINKQIFDTLFFLFKKIILLLKKVLN
ncbi:hypothetical protein TRFO_23643 [Tritrichomonas foetus]|uniref:Uncharacterized protein n=1 Tax=Tritrichomonas foetus TaxID=1144522 RepID=A0A1J4KAL9_9EUKA|nr:hypothetical protein TRFO_23643 [Tritrichomonas foetus]|eukprot:OHT08018.1 hypothetical protein TRFO_23643 [Tritrichomonas foetus]